MARVVAVVNDLFFAERIGGALRQLGHEASVIDLSMGGLPADLLPVGPAPAGPAPAGPAPADQPPTGGSPADLLLADLEGAEPALEAIRRAKAAGVPVLAFGPHVDLTLREQALVAGATKVVAKSKLTASFVDLLAELLPR